MVRPIFLLLIPILATALRASFSANNYSQHTYANIEDFMEKYRPADVLNPAHNKAIETLISRLTYIVKKMDKNLIEAKRHLKIVQMLDELRRTLQAFESEPHMTDELEDKYDALMVARLFPIASSALLSLKEKQELIDIVCTRYPEFDVICDRSLDVAEEIHRLRPQLRAVSQPVRHAYLLVLRLHMEMHNKDVVQRLYHKLEDLLLHFTESDHDDLFRLADHLMDEHKWSHQGKEEMLINLQTAQKLLFSD